MRCLCGLLVALFKKPSHPHLLGAGDLHFNSHTGPKDCHFHLHISFIRFSPDTLRSQQWTFHQRFLMYPFAPNIGFRTPNEGEFACSGDQQLWQIDQSIQQAKKEGRSTHCRSCDMSVVLVVFLLGCYFWFSLAFMRLVPIPEAFSTCCVFIAMFMYLYICMYVCLNTYIFTLLLFPVWVI